MTSYFALFFCVLGTCAAQVILKLGVMKIENLLNLQILLNPYLLIGLLIYALSFLLWLYVLQTLPFTVAFSSLAINFAIMPILSQKLFSEPYSLSIAFGSLLIVVGIVLIGISFATD